MFTAKEVDGAIEALAGGDGAAALEILKRLLVAAAAGDEAAADPAAASTDGGGTTTESAQPPAEDEETMAAKALARSVMTLSNTTTAGAADTWIKKLAAERASLDADRAALEHSERVSLVTELIALRAETPAFAWERDAAGNVPEGAARKPCKRLSAEPIADLRERVKALRPAGAVLPVTPAPRGAVGVARKLSRAELAYCEKHKITADEFEARKSGAVRTQNQGNQ